MSHVTYKSTWRTYWRHIATCTTLHTHVSRIKELYHIWMSHVTYKSTWTTYWRHIATCTVAPTLPMDLHWQMGDSYATWLVYKWHDSFIRDMTSVPWRIYIREYALQLILSLPLRRWICIDKWVINMQRDSFISDMTHSHEIWRIHVPWRIYIRECALRIILSLPLRWWIDIDKRVNHMRSDSFISDMTYAYETWRDHTWHDVFIYENAHCELYCRSYSADSSALSDEWFLWVVTDLHWQMRDLYETWLIYKWHDSCIRNVTYSRVPWRIHMR